MLFAKHIKFDEKGAKVNESMEIIDETLHDVLTRKKSKLITELRTEKVIDPSTTEEADIAIDTIKKSKEALIMVGNVGCQYCSQKGMYFYIHKVVRRDGSYANSVHVYFASHYDKELEAMLLKRDQLFLCKKES